ncbi:MAG: winged helix-turn-helix transcriptional regulator, partial [Bacteroidetes bacterium]|nr:winged helix-turn-helix transcriptional regulator [Bacteroidota bacterium]
TSALRAFNRFYKDIMGLLDRPLLDSPSTLPEARVLYELSRHESITASEITGLLRMDKGYLSRIVLQFEKKKLLTRKPSREDGRVVQLSLTAAGKKAFEALNRSSNEQAGKILAALTHKDCDQLVHHMKAIKTILTKTNQHDAE